MKKTILLLAFLGFFLIQNVSAQISASAIGGLSFAKGETFGSKNGGAGIGVNYEASALYHLPSLQEKLGVGLAYNESFMWGGSGNDKNATAGIYKIQIIGAKSEYRFLKRKFSPYVGLTAGLSRFEILGIEFNTTEETMDGAIDDISSFSFGLLPEAGLDIGYFRMAVGYIVPMKYKAIMGDKKSAGAIQFSLGIRYGFGLDN